MPRQRLTLPRIAQFNPGTESYLWDTDAPRLALRTRPSGAKTFIFKGTLRYKEIKVTIGSVSDWTIEDAREEARRLQKLIDSGEDPREVRRKEEEAKAASKAATEAAKEAAAEEKEKQKHYTLAALCEAYVGILASRDKAKSAAEVGSSFRLHVVQAFPDVAALPARDITSFQIAAVVRRVREKGKERAAGILRSYLSAAFNCAVRAPFDSALPSTMIPFDVQSNPVLAIPAIPVKAGTRALSPEELKVYIGHLGSGLPDQALRLALFAGGQRMAQLLRAQLSDWNQETSTLRLWDGKGKRVTAREHLLPLGPVAAELVSRLEERVKGKVSTWLFSAAGDVPMVATTPGKRVAEICLAMKCEAFDLKDIRRTVETMMAAMGISKATRAQLLSHGLSGVQQAHYDKHDYLDEKRNALQAWENRLVEI